MYVDEEVPSFPWDLDLDPEVTPTVEETPKEPCRRYLRVEENELHFCYICGYPKAAANMKIQGKRYLIYVHESCLADAGVKIVTSW